MGAHRKIPTAASGLVTPGVSAVRFMAILVVTTALGPMAMQIFLPALPTIQAHFAVSPVLAQLVFSASAFAMAIATLFYGPASDRYGRRPAMLWGLVIFLLGSFLCAVAGSIHLLILGRIVQAAGGCVGMVLARAIIRDVYDRDRSATMIAYLTMAMVVAPMVSPALGGVITDLLHWRLVFVLGGILGIGVLVAVWHDLRETAPRIGQATSALAMLGSFKVLLASRAFLGFAGQAAFSMSVFFGFLAAAPYLMIEVYGRQAVEYGLLFIMVSAAFMAGNFITARFTRHFGIERMIVLGSLGALVGALVALGLALIGHWYPLAIFVPMAFSAFAQGLAMPNTQAAMVSVQPDLAGAASGLGGFMQLTVASIAAQTMGSIQIGNPYPMTIGMSLCAALSFLSALVALRASSRD